MLERFPNAIQSIKENKQARVSSCSRTVAHQDHSSSECLDWAARQAPPELRRSVSNWIQLTPGKLFICTLQPPVSTTRLPR